MEFAAGNKMKIMEKLISMTAFVFEQDKSVLPEMKKGNTDADSFYKIVSYAKFLSQPLTLGMFVPVGEYGKVLEEPKSFDFDGDVGKYDKAIIEYGKAKSRVLFEGFYKHHGWLYFPNQVELIEIGNSFINWQDVEWLKNDSFQDIILTETAKKQIFGEPPTTDN